MACMVGASTGAAVTAVVMIFEMTRDYHVIIPLIISVSVAYSMRRLLLKDTIYTMKLTPARPAYPERDPEPAVPGASRAGVHPRAVRCAWMPMPTLAAALKHRH